MQLLSFSNRTGEGGRVSTAWRQTMCVMTAPWHPYDQACCPCSRAWIFQPIVMKGEVRGRVLRFVILGTTVGVLSDHIAITLSSHLRQVRVQCTQSNVLHSLPLHPPTLEARKSQRVDGAFCCYKDLKSTNHCYLIVMRPSILYHYLAWPLV